MTSSCQAPLILLAMARSGVTMPKVTPGAFTATPSFLAGHGTLGISAWETGLLLDA